MSSDWDSRPSMERKGCSVQKDRNELRSVKQVHTVARYLQSGKSLVIEGGSGSESGRKSGLCC